MVERVAERQSLQEFYDQETKKLVEILKEANPVKIIRFLGSSPRPGTFAV